MRSRGAWCSCAGQHLGRPHRAAGSSDAAAGQHLHPPGLLPGVDAAGARPGARLLSRAPNAACADAQVPESGIKLPFQVGHLANTAKSVSSHSHPGCHARVAQVQSRFASCCLHRQIRSSVEECCVGCAQCVFLCGTPVCWKRPGSATGEQTMIPQGAALAEGGGRGAHTAFVIPRRGPLQQHPQRGRYQRWPRPAHQGQLAGTQQTLNPNPCSRSACSSIDALPHMCRRTCGAAVRT